MKIISHRGNIRGECPDKENRPSYIDCAIGNGYDVEIDVRYLDGGLWLGHDGAQYKVDHNWLDKRKAYLSSLIHSKQMSRDEAIKITKNKSYNPDEIQKDFQYVASKLGISTIELQSIFKKKNKFHTHYKSKDLILKLAVFIKRAIGDEKRLFI